MAQGPNWQGSGKEIGTANKVKKNSKKHKNNKIVHQAKVYGTAPK